MSGAESAAIRRRLARAERLRGKPVVLRGMHPDEPGLKGRICERPSHLLVEYADAPAGYFWHYQTIEDLLDHVERGATNLTVYEDSSHTRLPELPVRSAPPGGSPAGRERRDE